MTLPTLDGKALRLSKRFLITHIKESSIRSHQCQLVEQFLCSDDSFTVIVTLALSSLLHIDIVIWLKIDLVIVVQSYDQYETLQSTVPHPICWLTSNGSLLSINIGPMVVQIGIIMTSNGRIKRDTASLSK